MSRIFICVATILVLIQPWAIAQQAGENINVLPVVVPVDSDDNGEWDDPAWYIKGDGYLQRQVEPTIAASTRNPDHLLAFFNDYRGWTCRTTPVSARTCRSPPPLSRPSI